MSRIVELLDQAINASREAKEESAKRGDKVMSPTLIPYRGADRIAVVIAGTEGSNALLNAAHLCIKGFAADVLVLAFDSFIATVLENPMTGEDWGPGEMQLVADKHHGIERGWVSDAIHVMAVNRADDIVSRTMPYTKVSRHRITWKVDPAELRRDDGAGDAKVGGRIPDALRASMAEAPLQLEMEQAGFGGDRFGLTPEEALARADLGVADVLTRKLRCTVALQAAEGTKRAYVFAMDEHARRL